MKIVLLQDVKNQGKKGDIVEVSDGYARNFILPKKLGVEATPGNLNTLKVQKEAAARQAAEQLAEAQALAGRIGSVKVVVSMKVGVGGKTFGAISAKEIADAMKEQNGIELDKKKIVLSDPIKDLGEKQVDIKLHKDVTAKLHVLVKAME